MTQGRSRRIFTGLAAACAASAALAQSPTPQQPTFRVGVNLVRVDVFPTLDGRPVPDLRLEDFEVLEDKVPQRIETFEYVVVRAAGPQHLRVEPNTVREGNEMAADPRNRVFVLFLDTYHVSNEGSRRMQRPLVQLLDRLIGQDDLVGIMTPEMSAANLTLGRKTISIEGMLTEYGDWGRRFDITRRDPEEDKYEVCYPDPPPPFCDFRGIARELIERRREKRSLDAVQDLVRHLQGLRDERKAILVITEGWRLLLPRPALARAFDPRCAPAPGMPEIRVGPTGKLTTAGDPRAGGVSWYECERDRLNLAQIDNSRQFREILDEANRANASFYPVDPRGLPVFDTPIGPDYPAMPVADRALLTARIESLRTMAVATDGMAIVGSNDIESGLRRVVDDLTSYYLLGYYSTNAKLDGKFRSITVRVKRPDVAVRARRGYRGATVEEIAGATAAPEPVSEVASPEASAASTAVAALSAIRPEAAFRVHAVPQLATAAAGAPDGEPRAAPSNGVWVVGELDAATARSAEWREGAGGDVVVTTADGRTLGSAAARIAPGARSFMAKVPIGEAQDSRDWRVRVRMRPAAGGGLPVADVVRAGGVLFFRRGPSTGTQYEPTADLRFRRNERARLEMPVAGSDAALSARLRDRGGQPLPVPVTVAERRDPDGSIWLVADLALAPLGPGDYVIELEAARQGAREQVVAALRVVP